MTSSPIPITIRAAFPQDVPFILSSWIQSMFHNDPFIGTDRNWFSAAQHALSTALITKGDTLVACNPDETWQIYGWLVGHRVPRWLHFVYVKEAFRRLDVGTRLMLAAFGSFDQPIRYGIRTSCTTHYVDRWNLEWRSHILVEAIKGERK